MASDWKDKVLREPPYRKIQICKITGNLTGFFATVTNHFEGEFEHSDYYIPEHHFFG